MSRVYRLTVLRCDFVPEPDRSRHGDAHERMIKHLEQAASELGIAVEVDCFDAYGGELPPADHAADLYVTTGSATDPDSTEPWVEALRAWMRRAIAAERPVYGVCFGHQLLAHALGGETRRHPDGWEVGSVEMKQLFPLGTAGGAPGALRLLMSHQDEVSVLPAGAKQWLRGAFCELQGFVIPGLAVTVQGHPEYAPEQVTDLYERRRTIMGDALTDGARESLAHSHHGLQLTMDVLRYLLPLGG